MDQLDPRQIEFLKYYLDVNSETFGNAYQSAIRAKFSEEYAKNIASRGLKWVSEGVRDDAKLLLKAIRNLDKLLDEEEDKKVKADITKFVAERLGKNKFSTRQEYTGKNGEQLTRGITDNDLAKVIAIYEENKQRKDSNRNNEA